MAQAKFVQRGEALDFFNDTGADIAALDVVKFGGGATAGQGLTDYFRAAIAATDIPAGKTGTVFVTGIFRFDFSNGNFAYSKNTPIYWRFDDLDGELMLGLSYDNYLAFPLGVIVLHGKNFIDVDISAAQTVAVYQQLYDLYMVLKDRLDAADL
jgi:predicted RecA/RadA family phage recombinase